MTARYLTAREVAERMSWSLATAYRRMHSMVHLVDGGTLRVSEAALEAYLRRKEV